MRLDLGEHCDDPALPEADVEAQQADLARFHEVFDSYRPVLDGLVSLGEGRPTALILDVGAGDGAFAAGLAARGGPRRIVCLDRHPAACRRARARGLAAVVGDARALPFRDHVFDAAISSLLLHHFDPPNAVWMLAEMSRTARAGVVVGDLPRSVVLALLSPLAVLLFGRSRRVSAWDAFASYLRAYTPREQEAIAAEAFLEAECRRHLLVRTVLVGRRPGVTPLPVLADERGAVPEPA